MHFENRQGTLHSSQTLTFRMKEEATSQLVQCFKAHSSANQFKNHPSKSQCNTTTFESTMNTTYTLEMNLMVMKQSTPMPAKIP